VLTLRPIRARVTWTYTGGIPGNLQIATKASPLDFRSPATCDVQAPIYPADGVAHAFFRARGRVHECDGQASLRRALCARRWNVPGWPCDADVGCERRLHVNTPPAEKRPPAGTTACRLGVSARTARVSENGRFVRRLSVVQNFGDRRRISFDYIYISIYIYKPQ